MAKFETGHKRSNTGAVVMHEWHVKVHLDDQGAHREPWHIVVTAQASAKPSTVARKAESHMSMTGYDMLNTYMKIERGEKL